MLLLKNRIDNVRNQQMQKISRRDFNKKFAAGAAGITAVSSGLVKLHGMTKNNKNKSGRPNIVFILSDQHNAKYAGYAGHSFVRTPNMDKLAKRGVVFTNNYSGNPVCTPGRSCLMTGMYASDVNSFCNSTVYDGSYPTWGKMLRDFGYYCWATGKSDMNPDFDMGFVEVDVKHGHRYKPDITSLFRRPCIYRVGQREGINGKSRDKRSNDEKKANNAVNFIENESVKLEKPWACYVGYHQPHPKFVGLKKYYEEYLEKIEVEDVSIEELENLPLPYQEMRNYKRVSTPIPVERRKRAMAAYFAMISELDEYVGRVYDAVEKTGQLDNTYFVYTSDHGESLGEHGLWYKNNLYDVASRVPLIISGPDIPNNKSISQPVGHIDMVAAMMEWAGVEKTDHLRGTSLMPLINGNPEKGPQFAYTESHSEGNVTGSCMIRVGDYKLMHFSYFEDYLFNLKTDPDEKENLINDPKYKNKADELRKLLYSLVDPEEITERAFRTQDKMLKNFTETISDEELMGMFERRLGRGQSQLMINKLKAKQ